jgi:hypothetical protein
VHDAFCIRSFSSRSGVGIIGIVHFGCCSGLGILSILDLTYLHVILILIGTQHVY